MNTSNRNNGNMYKFITGNFNPVKGKCYHDCKYCYMKKIGQSPYIDLDESLLKQERRRGETLFVVSGSDLFAENVPDIWIKRVLDFCYDQNNQLFKEKNVYFFQSKNPKRVLEFIDHPIFKESIVCTTIESNRFYPEYMGNCPLIEERVNAMEKISSLGIRTQITIEPIMEFKLDELVDIIRRCKPEQVNIGVNTFTAIKLPEPTLAEVIALIRELTQFTYVYIKDNLKERYNLKI